MIEEKRIYSLFDEYDNIDCAITILSGLFEKYEEPSLVLMCYNMGEDGANRLWEAGRWETDYVISVTRKMSGLDYDSRLNAVYKL